MANENKITIQIKAEVDKALKGLKKVQTESKKTGKVASQITGEFSKLGTFLKGGFLAAGIAGLTAGFVKLVSSAIKTSAQFEQTRIAFETFLGSAEKGAKVLKELEDFSIVTPFTITQVQKAAKTLLAFGIPAEKMQNTLKILGNVSAGTGKDLSELAVIVGQVSSLGKLQGQDLLQLVNAGFNPLQQIAKRTGKSMATLKDEMSKGLITFDQVEQAFEDASAEGGLFFNLMEKQSQTVAGRFSTLQGNVQLLAASFGDVLAPAIGTVIDLLNKTISVQEEETEVILDNSNALQARFSLLRQNNSNEATRIGILRDLNAQLKELGVTEIGRDQRSGLINKTEKEALAILKEKIDVANRQKEINALTDLETDALARLNIEREKLVTNQKIVQDFTPGEFFETPEQAEALVKATANRVKIIQEEVNSLQQKKVALQALQPLEKEEEDDDDDDDKLKLSQDLETQALLDGIASRSAARLRDRAKQVQEEKERSKLIGEIRTAGIKAGFDAAQQITDAGFAGIERRIKESGDRQIAEAQRVTDEKIRILEAEFIFQNEFREQLAALEDRAVDQNNTTLERRVQQAELAGNQELADKLRLDLKRNKLNKLADERDKQIAIEKKARDEFIANERVRLEKEQAEETARIRTAQAKREKRAAIIKVLINGQQAAGLAMATIPWPGGLIAGIAAAAQSNVHAGIIAAQPDQQFQQGTSFVPRTGMALIHEGERVLTREENINNNNDFNGATFQIVTQDPEDFTEQLNNYMKERGSLNTV